RAWRPPAPPRPRGGDLGLPPVHPAHQAARRPDAAPEGAGGRLGRPLPLAPPPPAGPGGVDRRPAGGLPGRHEGGAGGPLLADLHRADQRRGRRGGRCGPLLLRGIKGDRRMAPSEAGSPGSVYLIDASPYIFRAHYSLPSSIRTPEGEPAAASRGFATFLLGLIDAEKPAYLGVTFDRQLNSSFRNETYPAYKAQRDLPPPEIEAQIDTCVEIAGALGAATYIDERYESDDLIATICRQTAREPNPVVVVTSDK